MFNETELIANDRQVLYAWTREPSGPTRGVVAHVHGMGEHSRRYDHLSAYWAARGYASAGFDQRGHGRSPGPRGHTPSYEQLLDDVAAFLESVTEKWGDLPVTLYGHSMGGNVVLSYGLQRQPALAVVASAPYLRFAREPTPGRLVLARALTHLAPAVSFANGLELAALSRDPLVVEAFRADPLVHDRVTATFFAEIRAAAASVLARAADTARPTLVMHGDADRITAASASREYVERTHGRATLKVWPGYYHELHNEPGWEAVAAYVLSWMEGVPHPARPMNDSRSS
ncbi:lysophospholipase [Luteitalea sp. TBR-22]|uniref:alpha/beta hydrolase n=1 Tax=Luteitalea sp. TBR-22 TaxID=2802971 RepID=UPI001AF4B33E|nr:alpha/beta hydrolase [Luteitalea sp. TBR-22]BCS32626.1 lysophospholipase [Luteitalea sp. TBR-22]